MLRICSQHVVNMENGKTTQKKKQTIKLYIFQPIYVWFEQAVGVKIGVHIICNTETVKILVSAVGNIPIPILYKNKVAR